MVPNPNKFECNDNYFGFNIFVLLLSSENKCQIWKISVKIIVQSLSFLTW
jgi:hypothetical protein